MQIVKLLLKTTFCVKLRNEQKFLMEPTQCLNQVKTLMEDIPILTPPMFFPILLPIPIHHLPHNSYHWGWWKLCKLKRASPKTCEASQLHIFNSLLMLRHRAALNYWSKVLSTLSCIHKLTHPHNWLVSLWLTADVWSPPIYKYINTQTHLYSCLCGVFPFTCLPAGNTGTSTPTYLL